MKDLLQVPLGLFSIFLMFFFPIGTVIGIALFVWGDQWYSEEDEDDKATD